MKIFSFLLIAMLLVFSQAHATVLWSDDLDDYANVAAAISAWGSAYNGVALETSGCNGGSGKCYKLTYTTNAGWPYPSVQYADSEDFGGEFYLKFYAKVTNRQSAWPKFLKFFGSFGPGGSGEYSNWYLGNSAADSTDALRMIQHGGCNQPGDGQAAVNWRDNTTTSTCGSPGTIQTYAGSAFNFNDENWHEFIIYFKYNTNGNADGAWRIWIDDTEYLHITGIVNRNDNNPRTFQYMSIGEYAQQAPSSNYYIWYDDFVVGTTLSDVTETAECSADNLELCTTQEICEAAILNWCDGACQVAACSSTNIGTVMTGVSSVVTAQ